MRMSRCDSDIRCSVYQRFCIGWRYDKVQRAMKRAELNDWLVMMRAARSKLEYRTKHELSEEGLEAGVGIEPASTALQAAA